MTKNTSSTILMMAAGMILAAPSGASAADPTIDLSRPSTLWGNKARVARCQLGKGRSALCAVASARGIRNPALARQAADARARGLLARRLGRRTVHLSPGLAPGARSRLRVAVTEAVLRATAIHARRIDRRGRVWSLAVLDSRLIDAGL